MFATHPRPSKLHGEELVHCIEACVNCAAICTTCADACLGEEMVKDLIHCIRTNLDCAGVCQVTGDLLARQTEPDFRLLFHQVQACQTACRVCAEECERHAQMHEHCRICAETCRHCERACDKLLATFPA